MYINFNWIVGLSLGVEYNRIDEVDYLVFDLFFIRIVLEKDVVEE